MVSAIGLYKTELIKKRGPWKTLAEVGLALPAVRVGLPSDDSRPRRPPAGQEADLCTDLCTGRGGTDRDGQDVEDPRRLRAAGLPRPTR